MCSTLARIAPCRRLCFFCDDDSFRPGFSVKETPQGRRYFSTVPMMAPGVLRNIARIAGVHVYTETNEEAFRRQARNRRKKAVSKGLPIRNEDAVGA